MIEPIVFEPLAMERVWGGRRFESLGKVLPHGVPVGELWEVVDREDAQSVVHRGQLRGLTLHELWQDRRREIFGSRHADHEAERFPLLVKLLDARERLSVQVHPPAHMAKILDGEPKTEVWYFLDSLPAADIYAGLRHGVTREKFESLLRTGDVEQALHRISVHTGESIFIPSGRLHAIGAGNLIVEIQQNSDTTYRVFDWNRHGLDGKPRALHIEQSLASIDFEDFEPQVKSAEDPLVADCPLFRVEKHIVGNPADLRPESAFALIAVTRGGVHCGKHAFTRGQFFLVPAAGKDLEIHPASSDAEVLTVTLP